MNSTFAEWGRRLLLMAVLSVSLIAYTAQVAESQATGGVQADDMAQDTGSDLARDPALCFLTLGSGCVAAAYICDNSIIPGEVCDALFDHCIETALDICFKT